MRRNWVPTQPPHTTVHVGTIKGGTVLNVVPTTCEFLWEFRGLPGTDDEDIPRRFNQIAETHILPKLNSDAAAADIQTTRFNQVPAFQAANQSEAVTLALSLVEQNETLAVSYGTEAGLFEEGGCPTVVCGPGNIAQAHKPNEFIERDQLDKCSAFLDKLTDYVAA